MDRNFLFELTNKLYQTTLLFPRKEPLRYKTREVADDILAIFIAGQRDADFSRIEAKLDILGCFLDMAALQKWVKMEKIQELKKGYNLLNQEMDGEPNLTKSLFEKTERMENIQILIPNKKETIRPIDKDINNFSTEATTAVFTVNQPNRHERILSTLKEKGRAQVWEFKKIFPEVTKRTLRRDFENLLKRGLVERIGERNTTFYQLKG